MEAALNDIHTWKVFDLRIKERKITCDCFTRLTGGWSSKFSLSAWGRQSLKVIKPGSWGVSQPQDVASHYFILTSGGDPAALPSNGATGWTWAVPRRRGKS